MTVYIYASCTCIGWMYRHEGCNQQTSDKFLTQHLRNLTLNVGYFKEKKYFMSCLCRLNFLIGNKMSTAITQC